jgi:hypothetical protein
MAFLEIAVGGLANSRRSCAGGADGRLQTTRGK